jgi:hypothetical protein
MTEQTRDAWLDAEPEADEADLQEQAVPLAEVDDAPSTEPTSPEADEADQQEQRLEIDLDPDEYR